jgi:hypothetical protein
MTPDEIERRLSRQHLLMSAGERRQATIRHLVIGLGIGVVVLLTLWGGR